ncbi:MAG: hypothetical protein JO002_02345, partial [Burkholderiaceae bacterium]|nr:hypothetical protein [Burkholderiaceae bacterium]
MFSTFIRLGAALSCAALLSSCGGNSVAETQQSTPEGIFTGDLNVSLTNSAGTAVNNPYSKTQYCSDAVVQFAVATGSLYIFYPSTTNPAALNAASTG